MRPVTSIEECNSEEIRFLREGDIEYQIEGHANVKKFMTKLEEFSLFDHQEEALLRHVGLEAFHNEIDFKHTLNLLDRLDIDILKKYSQQIN